MPKKNIEYRIHEHGFVFYEGNAHLPRFFRAMAPDVVSLRTMLQEEFPGEALELVLVQ